MKYSWMLYDAAGEPDQINKMLKDWAEIALFYNKKLGLEPTSIGLSGDEFSGKITAFKKGYKKAEEQSFNGIDAISIYTETADDKDFAFYYQVLMSISYSKRGGFKIYAGMDTSAAGKDELINEVILPICNLFDVTYGYSYVMPPEKGPLSYGTGFVHVPEGHPLSDAEEQLIFKWNHYTKTMKERKGKLRDVYEENLLTDEHLNQNVAGKSLKNWVLSDPLHGTLSDLAGRQYWKVDKDNLVQVRMKLQEDGLLIAYHENIIPGLS